MPESTYIEPIEDAIAVQLAPLESDGLKIENRPASGSATPKARALVYLSEINPDTLKGSGTTQPEEMRFEISLELIDQRSHQKAYPFIEGIRNRLNSHRLTGTNGTMVKFNGVQYQSYQDGNGVYWRYLLRFSTTAMWVRGDRR